MNMITIEDWRLIVNGEPLIEFDWFAVNKANQLAVFSSVGGGYIPSKVLQSYEDYLSVYKIIHSLKVSTSAVLVTRQPGNLKSWMEYSDKGLWAYDHQDFHRIEKTGNYDLISKPLKPLISDLIPELKPFLGRIPVLNISFETDIVMKQLESCEIP